MEVAGVAVRAPALDIRTVAAGGGSICRYGGFRLTVGPDSAGADPGPICYGRGGRELTVTDVDLALGRVVGDRFPFPLAREPVDRALAAVADAIAEAEDRRMSSEEIATGFAAVASANMAEAIRQVSIARGRDPRDFALVVFAGAGGQHACAVARQLGIRTLLCDRRAGVLSAWGMGLAAISWHGEADAGRRPLGPDLLADLEPTFAALEARGRAALARDGVPVAEHRRTIDLRYVGADTAIAVDAAAPDLAAAFSAEHRRLFGYARPGHPIEAHAVRGQATGPQPPNQLRFWHQMRFSIPSPVGRRGCTPADGWSVRSSGAKTSPPVGASPAPRWSSTRPRPPSSIPAGSSRSAPMASWSSETARRPRAQQPATRRPIRWPRDLRQPLHVDRPPDGRGPPAHRHLDQHPRAARLLLRRLRPRRRAGGQRAAHPGPPRRHGRVGARRPGAHPDPLPGSAFATNDPSAGGSHLPDVTVVAPVHGDGGELLFFTASRGHHADIGGTTPGSMPPDSRTLAEEGAVLRTLPIVAGGVLDRDRVLAALAAGPYPARRPRDNLADLEAQLAACATGARLLGELCAASGTDLVLAYLGHVQDNAAAQVAAEIARLPDGAHRFADALDDGTPIAVSIQVAGSTMEIDFAGTGAEVDGNLNAPRAVTVAAVLYVLRCLVGAPIPLNAGCLRPVTLRVPPGSILDPSPGRAVAGGNVETSQRVVDVLLAALGLAAASQGTMNNLTFGDDAFGYYETIAGGAGATRHRPGASGVHTHMTNTRITDPEVLESRYPVRLLELSLRRGSGGAGRNPGGDGLVRELELLRPLEVAILSERRRLCPFGLAGGQPGAAGANLHNGRPLGGRARFRAATGDRIRIETPGGGGYGPPAGSAAPAP